MRAMETRDIDSVYAIEIENFTDPWTIQTFEESISQIDTYVLEDTEIVSYFVGQGVIDEYSIYNIAVKSTHQRKGIATHFLKMLIEKHNKTFTKYFLECRKTNDKAINFYTKFGFQPIYTRKEYYHNPTEDALIMKLDIGT